MDDNVGVPRTGEGLSVVPSLSEVSEQIAIAEHIPTEHETTTTAVFHAGEEASNTNVGGHPQCEVQVVKVGDGNVSISFATPAPAVSHIQASQASLQPIQEVIADSPAHSTRSSSPNLQESQAVTTIQQAEQDEISGNQHADDGSPLARQKFETQGKSAWDAALSTDILIVRCRNETAELFKTKLGSGGRGKCIKVKNKSSTLVLDWFSASQELGSLISHISCNKDVKCLSFRFYVLGIVMVYRTFQIGNIASWL